MEVVGEVVVLVGEVEEVVAAGEAEAAAKAEAAAVAAAAAAAEVVTMMMTMTAIHLPQALPDLVVVV